METKSCSKCKEEKPFTDFYRHRSRKDGRTPYCKTCAKKMEKSWKSIDKTKYRRERYHTDPVFNLEQRMRSSILFNCKRVSSKKTTKTSKIIGKTGKELLSYLTNDDEILIERFKKGELSVDHIVPVAWFNKHNLYLEAHTYKNLQLIEANENLKKSDNINISNREQIKLLIGFLDLIQ